MPGGAEIIPLRLEQSPDITRFERFAVPNRALTTPEKGVYRKLAYDWARLDATTQTTLYAALCLGKLTRQLNAMFGETMAETDTARKTFDNPDRQATFNTFTAAMEQQYAQFLLGINLTAARGMEQVIAEGYPQLAQPKNVWQRMLAALHG